MTGSPRDASSPPGEAGRPVPFRHGRLELAPLVDALAGDGATSIALLDEGYRLALLAEARGYAYRPARPIVGKCDQVVRQRMGVFPDLPERSAFRGLALAFQRLWDEAVTRIPSGVFTERVVFNDLMLQKYEVGELGISPHRDRSAYRNIICLFVIAGRGRFCVCANRDAAEEREIPADPGHLILTRAPGFQGSDVRPFHLVRDIVETRYVFGLRHATSGSRR